jgi:hypothetical protein
VWTVLGADNLGHSACSEAATALASVAVDLVRATDELENDGLDPLPGAAPHFSLLRRVMCTRAVNRTARPPFSGAWSH